MPKGIYKRTKPIWNKGLKLGKNPEHSLRMKGKKHSNIHNIKIGEALKGRKFSEAHRKNDSESKKGDKNPNWKGGITTENYRIRRSISFSIWRNGIFSRDGWRCQKCFFYGGKLHPHHIQNFHNNFLIRFSLENGITLCKKCHKEFHKEYGYRNNNQEQLNQWMKNN